MWSYFIKLVITMILYGVKKPGFVCLKDYIYTFLYFYFVSNRACLDRVEIYRG